MGKGQKGKAKGQQKGNGKPKHMSAQNKKQLAKLDRILEQKKGRSQSKSGPKENSQKGFDKNKSHHANNKSRSQSFQRGGNNKNKGNNKQDRSASEWTERSNPKTKQISKQFGSGKQMKKRPMEDDDEDNVPIKGNPLFKIVPEGMDEDGFAALGGGNSDEEGSEEMGSGEEFDGEEYDGEDRDEQELEGEEQEEEGDFEEGEQEQYEESDLDEMEEDEQEGDEFAEDQAEQGDQQEEEQNEGEEDEQQQGKQGEQQQQAEQEQQQDEGLEQQQQKQPVDISVISLKLQQTIQILMNVAKLGAGKPRKHYIEQLKNLIHQYYGYNFELISHFLDFLNPSELIQFFEANETQRPLTIRTNTLKTRRKELAQALIQRGVNLDPLAEWSNVGIKIYETKVPIGATPEYLAGHYMLQSASSLLPVIALDPQPYEKILDMASAPGGKTTYIAQLMKNTGSVFANDLKKQRLRALQFNLYRLGVTNTAVTCRDGRKFGTIFPSTFDRVLLDAPCTGLGIIAKDHSIKATRLMIDIYKNSHLQKELLLAAIDSCKINGTIVYSTCSVSPLENEEVVNYALKRRFIKIVECGVEVGEEGLTKFVEKRFHVDLKKTRRIYPHVHNMDGFYVAKLIKLGKGKKEIKQEEGEENVEMMAEEGQEVEA